MVGQVNRGVARRRLLQAGIAAIAGTAALGRARAAVDDAPAGRATEPPAPAKFTPEAVSYQPSPNEWKKCLYCSYFQPPSTCAIVSGTISSEGWCTHFALMHE